uniref:Uncharacterized protein n=1 Tax=Arundo donax TaxID=35708 RepID=A0A0A9CCZ4_ARUDO
MTENLFFSASWFIFQAAISAFSTKRLSAVLRLLQHLQNLLHLGPLRRGTLRAQHRDLEHGKHLPAPRERHGAQPWVHDLLRHFPPIWGGVDPFDKIHTLPKPLIRRKLGCQDLQQDHPEAVHIAWHCHLHCVGILWRYVTK